jgi:hypothetical protein
LTARAVDRGRNPVYAPRRTGPARAGAFAAAALFGPGPTVGSPWPPFPAFPCSAFGNVIYFELQRRGGIVSFSQIGYGGPSLVLSAAPSSSGNDAAGTWAAALVIALGVAAAEIAKRRAARS